MTLVQTAVLTAVQTAVVTAIVKRRTLTVALTIEDDAKLSPVCAKKTPTPVLHLGGGAPRIPDLNVESLLRKHDGLNIH